MYTQPQPALITREHAIACATNVGRRLGYAIGVHGTKIRDLDLLAVPWIHGAVPRQELVESIAYALPGMVHSKAIQRPHGRLAWTIYPRFLWGIDAWYIDISVMPRRKVDHGD